MAEKSNVSISVTLPSGTHKISSPSNAPSSETEGPLKNVIGQLEFMQKAVNEYLTEKIKELKEPLKPGSEIKLLI